MSATTTSRTPQPTIELPPHAQHRIGFGALVRVEFGKATDTRAARWLLGLTLAATVLLMLAPLLVTSKINQDQATYLQFTAIALTTLLPVVAIMTMTSEWTQRAVLTTFVQEPRRERVMLAKVSAALIIATAAIAFGALVAALAVAGAEVGGRDIAANLTAGDVLGYVLYIVANVGLGVALGALLQNTAAAIVLFFIVPVVFGLLGSFAGAVARWVDPGTTFNWMIEGDWDGHGLRIAVAAVLWLALPLAAGLVRAGRREIS